MLGWTITITHARESRRDEVVAHWSDSRLTWLDPLLATGLADPNVLCGGYPDTYLTTAGALGLALVDNAAGEAIQVLPPGTTLTVTLWDES
jgi:hypothetical protein